MPPETWTEDRLVRECLQGSDDAWSALVDRYQNLVYSIPLKHGITGDEASDIFQAVFFELLSHLGSLRNPKALPMWLIKTASHKCLHYRKVRGRFTALATLAADPAEIEDPASGALGKEALAEWERERKVTGAMAELPERCRKLVEMLFYETPARPYEQVAKDLGLAPGSIGFIRARCLEKLRKSLDKAGL
jgi:RNA polymerase sigma factor (sigma-70 family)